MAGAQPLPRLTPGHRAGRGRGLGGAGIGAGTGLGAVLVLRHRPRRGPGHRQWAHVIHRPARFVEHCNADHPDIGRAAGAACIAVAGGGEHELRHLGIGFAPAGDLAALPGLQHIAGLAGRGCLAGDGVDPIHRQHHQHALAAAVLHAHAVAVARAAGHPLLAPVRVQVQFLPVVAVDHRQQHRTLICRPYRAEPA